MIPNETVPGLGHPFVSFHHCGHGHHYTMYPRPASDRGYQGLIDPGVYSKSESEISANMPKPNVGSRSRSAFGVFFRNQARTRLRASRE